jgi:hypothetical protein
MQVWGGWLGGISLLVTVIAVPKSGLRGELGVVLPRMLPQKILIDTKLRPLRKSLSLILLHQNVA